MELAGVRRLAAAAATGAVAGVVIGGIGGRLAMLLLRLTSDPILRGLPTDDGFTIGVISTDTLFLLVLTAVAGAVGGVAYLAIRSWLPERARPWVAGGITGLVGGAAIIRPDGIDFTRLAPLWLAVAMFVALPAAYGVATSLLGERFLRDGSAIMRSRPWPAGLVFLLPIGLLGPAGIGLAIAALAVAFLGQRAPMLGTIWGSAPVTWLGRAALTGVAGIAFVVLARDVGAVL